jgi:hypothetical protein
MDQILTENNLCVDDLDGKWTLFIYDAEAGTESLCCFDGNDAWLYPEDLRHDNVVNVFKVENIWQFNVYALPKNWKDIVTNDNGNDEKQSILDIMFMKG